MNDYTTAELMAAILNVHEAMGFGFSRVDERFAEQDKKIELLRNDMNHRFDRMDERFDRLEGRVAALEPNDHSPAS